MSTVKIQGALEKAFAQRRVVFWYDADGEWWPEYDAVELPGVKKMSVQNDEFTVKHRIAREAPKQKFLLYFRAQAQPPDAANWLLDQLLAHGPAFLPDRASLALIDAGLPPEFKHLTAQHLEFFRSAERVARLREWLQPDDTERLVRLKMLAAAVRAEPSVETILLALLDDLAQQRDDRWKLLEKFDLAGTWWQELARHFSYVQPAPTPQDFVLSLFRTGAPFDGAPPLDARQTLVFFNRWKDSQEHREAFATLSERTAQTLNVAAALEQADDVLPWLGNDTYRLIDLRLLADLRDGLVQRALPPEEIQRRAAGRQRLYWTRHDPDIGALYRALAVAAEFLATLPKMDFSMESFDAGLEKYAATWCRVDGLHRKFVQHAGESGQPALLESVARLIEGLYVNEYLGKLAGQWQEQVDHREHWSSTGVPMQREFFARFVEPQLAEGRKVVVIVSDALRYEAARELLERLLAQDRWQAELKPMLGALPSFTQLGMAALLPHGTLEFSADGQTILADGVSTTGLDNRAAILARRLAGRGTARRAADFLDLNSKTEGRELARANDVIYLYHNGIDAVGDKRDTEYRTCAAVESAMEDLLRLLRKVAAVNVSHMVITADHGFLYQHEAVAESDFVTFASTVAGPLKYDRRFVVAEELAQESAGRHFTAAQLGLAGTLEFVFPRGTQRLRLQGSGSRYVHGGTTLQEVVVPVLLVRKKRASDVGLVEIDLVRTGQQITTGQVAVIFLQCEPVGDKRLGRELRAAFFSKTGLRISDVKPLKFAESGEDARQRERTERFVFARAADAFNKQEVILRLEEGIAGTSQFAVYKEFPFRLKRSFDTDFDDFG